MLLKFSSPILIQFRIARNYSRKYNPLTYIPSQHKLNMEIIKEPNTLCEWAHKILYTEDPLDKVDLTNQAGAWWKSQSTLNIGKASVPEVPPRPSNFEIVAPGRAPKRGKAGSLASRISILHALANVEQWAIDTAWDNIVRFGGEDGILFPKGYYDDFVKMALDEAKHFNWLTQRLEELGAKFGDLPIHAGIWESAQQTHHMMPARMAIVHMVHEARGLDVNPNTIKNFTKHGDIQSAEMLDKIYLDEITHVEIGTRWFKYYCDNNKELMEEYLKKESELEKEQQEQKQKEEGKEETIEQIEIPDSMQQEFDDNAKYFHALVSKHFFGKLKPPFNYWARDQAGLSKDFYLPIADMPSPFIP